MTLRILPVRKLTFSASRMGTQMILNSRKEYRVTRRISRRGTPQALSWTKHSMPNKQSGSSGKPQDSWPKQQKQCGRGHWAQARSLKNKHNPPTEARVLPALDLPRDHTTTNQTQWHSEKSAGTRTSPSFLFANYPFRGSSRRLART